MIIELKPTTDIRIIFIRIGGHAAYPHGFITTQHSQNIQQVGPYIEYLPRIGHVDCSYVSYLSTLNNCFHIQEMIIPSTCMIDSKYDLSLITYSDHLRCFFDVERQRFFTEYPLHRILSQFPQDRIMACRRCANGNNIGAAMAHQI